MEISSDKRILTQEVMDMVKKEKLERETKSHWLAAQKNATGTKAK